MSKDRERRSSASEAARRRAREHTSEFSRTTLRIPDGISMFSIKKPGTYRIDIMPYIAGKGNPFCDKGQPAFERTFWTHRDVGPNQDQYVCLAKTAGQACPVCEAQAKMRKDPEADESVIKAMAPRERQLFNVIDKANPDKGIQLWEISYHLFGKLLDSRLKNQSDQDKEEEGDWQCFADLKGGFTLKLEAEEQVAGKNKFIEVTSIDFKPRKQDYDEDMMEQAHCLDDLVIVLPYDKLKDIYLQTGDAGGEDEDEDERKPSGRQSQGRSSAKDDEDEDEKPRNRKPKDDDEDEDKPRRSKRDEEDDIPFEKPSDEEDEEPEEKPKQGKTGKHARKDEDEEEDEKPRRSKRDEEEPEEKPKAKKGECPAGGRFGKDCDKLKECRKCPSWNACDDANG
jgi:hypothetical protein